MNENDPRYGPEFANRSMDRMMATAQYGTPKRTDDATVMTFSSPKGGPPVSVVMALADTEAALAELDIDAPCGICHQNPCSWRTPAEMLS